MTRRWVVALLAACAAVAALSPVALAATELNITPGAEYCGDALYISAAGVDGEDFSCTPIGPQTKFGGVALLCEFPEPGYGPPDLRVVTIIESVADKTLTYIGEDGTLTLRPCS